MNSPDPSNRCRAWGASSQAGPARPDNQDALICRPELGFFAVIDGMGGLPGGGQAARTLQREWPAWLELYLGRPPAGPAPRPGADLSLRASVDRINELIQSFNIGGQVHFGAAFCGVWLAGGTALFASMGDCRGYILNKRQKKIRQITRDHTVAQMLIQDGLLTREEALGSRQAHLLTRFSGMPEPAGADFFLEEVQAGDRILLCSDGLHQAADEELMVKIMRAGQSQPAVARQLVAAALAAGGRDDTSVICIRVGRESGG